MTATVLVVGWCAWALCVVWVRRPLPPRGFGRLPERRARQRPETAVAVGARAVSLLGRASGRQDLASHLDPRRVGHSLLAAAATYLISPAAAPAIAAVVWVAPALRARRERAARAAAVQRQLPEVVDLLALVTGAGATVPQAIAIVARRAGGVIGPELAAVVDAAAAGRRLADVLAERSGDLGEDARPLVAALVASERDGVPIGAGLERLAGELRQERRRRAETAARKVPVKLLFPLVSCILPAFALLTVAPLLAGALSALRP